MRKRRGDPLLLEGRVRSWGESVERLHFWIVALFCGRKFLFPVGHRRVRLGCLALLGVAFAQEVEGAAGFEPFDLFVVEGVGEGDLVFVAVGVVDEGGDGGGGGEVGEAGDADGVGLVGDLVVIIGVGEGEGEDALFFEVGFGDTGEAAGDGGDAPEEAWGHGGVFAAAAFAVVFVSDDGPAAASIFVSARDDVEGFGVGLVGEDVPAVADFVGEDVVGALAEVVADVVEVATKA